MPKVRVNRKHRRKRSVQEILDGVDRKKIKREAEHARRIELAQQRQRRAEVMESAAMNDAAIAIMRQSGGTHLDQIDHLFQTDKALARAYTGCRSFAQYKTQTQGGK
jgi:hypothetical protein